MLYYYLSYSAELRIGARTDAASVRIGCAHRCASGCENDASRFAPMRNRCASDAYGDASRLHRCGTDAHPDYVGGGMFVCI